MRPTDKIKQYIKNIQVKTNPKVNQAVLDDLLDRLDAAQSKQTQAPQPNIWRTMMKNRITKVSAAAAILIVGAVILSQFAFPGVTFAKVIKPIMEARTIAFDMLVGGEGGPVMHDRVSGSRIRRTMSNMPMTVMIIDMENARMLVLDTDKKTAAMVDITGPLQEGTRSFIAFVRETINRLMADPNFEPKEQSGQEIDGRKVVGYSFGNDREQVTILADAKTGAPVQIELKVGKETSILKNFEFDIPISEEEISMEAPAGYTMKQTNMDFSKVSEKDLVESLRVWAKYLNDGMFPSELATQAFMEQVPLLQQKIGPLPLPDAEKEQLGMRFIQGMIFLQTFEIERMEPWHYAGSGVKLGDAETAIFWYRPKGSQTYRVIYGDLSVKDVTPEDLPK